MLVYSEKMRKRDISVLDYIFVDTNNNRRYPVETIQQYLLPCNGELDINLVEDINNLDEKVLRVMIGLAQIECLPADRNHILVKMLIGRLYNANFKLKDLVEKFNRSPKTIRKWGMALLTGVMSEL